MCAFSSSLVVPPYAPFHESEMKATKKGRWGVDVHIFAFLACVVFFVYFVRVDKVVGDGCSFMPRGN